MLGLRNRTSVLFPGDMGAESCAWCGSHQAAPAQQVRFGAVQRTCDDKNKKSSRTINVRDDLVEEGGFEPPKRNATDLQSAPFGHSGTPPYEVVELVDGFEPPTC